MGGGITGATVAVFASRTITIGTTAISAEDTLSITVGSGTAQVITFKSGTGTNSSTFSTNAANVYIGNAVGTGAQIANQLAEAVEVLIDSISNITATHADEDGIITVTADTAQTTTYDLTIETIADANQISIGTATAGVTGVDGTDSTTFTLAVSYTHLTLPTKRIV